MLLNKTYYVIILNFILEKLDDDYLLNFLNFNEPGTLFNTNNFMNLISWVALGYSRNDLVVDVSRFITQYLGESSSDQILNLDEEKQRINENSESTVDANNAANREGNNNLTRFFNISWRSVAFNIARVNVTGLVFGYWIPRVSPGFYGWLGATAMGTITFNSSSQVVTRETSRDECDKTIGMVIDNIIKIIKDFWKDL